MTSNALRLTGGLRQRVASNDYAQGVSPDKKYLSFIQAISGKENPFRPRLADGEED